MKFKNLVILSTTALLSAAILPAATAQDSEPRFDRGAAGAESRPQRGPALGAARHRPGRPGGNPDRLIDRLDADGDGVVDEDEFLDARLLRIDDQFDRRDVDGDGLLSEEEARRHRPRRGDDLTLREEVIQCVRETIADWEGPHEVEDRFDAVDTDGDGYISLVELSTALQERAYVLFDRIDSNNDGLISLEEVEAHQDYQINLRRVIRACNDEITDPFEATL
jgi:Ca2+-binding EF-hand superfamily protein